MRRKATLPDRPAPRPWLKAGKNEAPAFSIEATGEPHRTGTPCLTTATR